MLKTIGLRCFVVLGSLAAASTPAQVWIESGDAPSFPDGRAQVTRGEALEAPRDQATVVTGTGPPSSTFGLATQARDARQIQVGVKFSF